MHTFRLTVNGQPRTAEMHHPDTPLLWVLRNGMQLTGTKYGCGMGLCGACTVLVNGVPTRACVTPASAIADQSITTIEGLSAASPHPVQRAWIAEQVVQCGYCQSGQILSAVALLARVPHPTDDEIDAAMAGNLCRCGTYPRIRLAIHRAARERSGSVEPA